MYGSSGSSMHYPHPAAMHQQHGLQQPGHPQSSLQSGRPPLPQAALPPAGYHIGQSYHQPSSGAYPPQSPPPGAPPRTVSGPSPPGHQYYPYPPPMQNYAHSSGLGAHLSQGHPGAVSISSGSYGASPMQHPQSSINSHSQMPRPPHSQSMGQPMLTTHHSLLPPFPTQAAGVADMRVAEVRLEIACENLRDRDFVSKSDPCAVVFLEEKRVGAPGGYPGGLPGGSSSSQHHIYMSVEHAAAASPLEVTHWREIGRTESIKDNLNPHFSVHVTVPYRFEELQNIRIGIWDIDSGSTKLDKHDFLGDIRTTLGDLVASGVTSKDLSYPNVRDQKKLLGGRRNLGKITVIVHENRDGDKLLVKGRFSGKKLAKRDLFSSDPYLIFTQLGVRGDSSRSHVYKTEVVRRNRNPVWRPVKFKVDLPKGGSHSHIKLELLCNDKDIMSCDDEIGIAKCTLAELESAEKLPLMYTKRKGRRGYTNSGHIIVQDIKAVRMPSLIEYLQGGLKLHFNVAVDLTASNGDPRDPNSLHYLDQNFGANQYVRALSAIGNILQSYAPNDNMFAAYGFGAELPGQTNVASSCFPLNLSSDPRCPGVNGIINAYTRVLRTVRLSGPTNFSPLIETVSRTAAARRNDKGEQNVSYLLQLIGAIRFVSISLLTTLYVFFCTVRRSVNLHRRCCD